MEFPSVEVLAGFGADCRTLLSPPHTKRFPSSSFWVSRRSSARGSMEVSETLKRNLRNLNHFVPTLNSVGGGIGRLSCRRPTGN
jgi:hypothetical protein